MYQHGLRVGSFSEQAREIAHGRAAITTDFGTFAQNPRSILQSLNYLITLAQQYLRRFLELVHSEFNGEEELGAGKKTKQCAIPSSTRATTSGTETVENQEKLSMLGKGSWQHDVC